MEIYGAKINGLNDSVGFEYDPLLCFWKIRESRGEKQMNSKIQVATDADLAAIVYEKEGDLNCVGEVLDFALQPYTRYFYQITVESDVGEVARSEIHLVTQILFTLFCFIPFGFPCFVLFDVFRVGIESTTSL